MENPSDSDSNSSSWIIVDGERAVLRIEIEDIKLQERNSDAESESDGISVISESDSLYEDIKSVETSNAVTNYQSEGFIENYNTIVVPSKICPLPNITHFDSENKIFDSKVWVVVAAAFIYLMYLAADVHFHSKYLNTCVKANSIPSEALDKIVDTTIDCVNTVKVEKESYNYLDVKKCVNTYLDLDVQYLKSHKSKENKILTNKTKKLPKFENLMNKFGKECKYKVKDVCISKKLKKNNGKDKVTRNTKKKDIKKTTNNNMGEWFFDWHEGRDKARNEEKDNIIKPNWYIRSMRMRNTNRLRREY